LCMSRYASSTKKRIELESINLLRTHGEMKASTLTNMLNASCNVAIRGRKGKGLYNLLLRLMKEGVIERRKGEFVTYSLRGSGMEYVFDFGKVPNEGISLPY